MKKASLEKAMPSQEVPLSVLLSELQSGSRPKGGVRDIASGVISVGGEHLNDKGGFDWSNKKYVPISFYKKMKRGNVKQNDIMIVKDGATTGKISFVDATFPYLEAVVNEHVFLCRANEKVIPKYLFHFLFSKEGQKRILKHFRGSAQGGINQGFAHGTLIPLVPIPSQKKIAELIDVTLPKVYSAQERTEKAKRQLKRFRQSILSAAFEGDLTAEWRKKNNVSITDWEPRRLDSIFTIRSGGTPSRKNAKYYQNGTIPWIKTGEVKNADIFSSEERITELAMKESNAKVFPVGTLLVAMYGEGKTRGQVGWLRIAAATNQACAALINDGMDDVTRRFTFYFLLSQYQKLRAQAVGGNQPNLNLGIVKEWQMPLPSPQEQEEVVSRLKSYLEAADKAEQAITIIENDCDRTVSSVLAAAFQGRLR